MRPLEVVALMNSYIEGLVHQKKEMQTTTILGSISPHYVLRRSGDSPKNGAKVNMAAKLNILADSTTKSIRQYNFNPL